MQDRLAFLDTNAKFRRVSLFWCLTSEPPVTNVFRNSPQENATQSARRLAELQKTATLLEAHLRGSIGLQLLDKQEAFRFFRYLFNLEEWGERARSAAMTASTGKLLRVRFPGTTTTCALGSGTCSCSR